MPLDKFVLNYSSIYPAFSRYAIALYLFPSPNKNMTEAKNNHWLSPIAIGAYFAVFKLLLHFIFNSNYGYFRDELYYLACGEHLAWGYPDHAPMVAFVAKASRAFLGD